MCFQTESRPHAEVPGRIYTSHLVPNRNNLHFLRNGMEFTVQCTYQLLSQDATLHALHIKNTAGHKLFEASFTANTDTCLADWMARCTDITHVPCAGSCETRVTVSGYNAVEDGMMSVCEVVTLQGSGLTEVADSADAISGIHAF